MTVKKTLVIIHIYINNITFYMLKLQMESIAYYFQFSRKVE